MIIEKEKENINTGKRINHIYIYIYIHSCGSALWAFWVRRSFLWSPGFVIAQEGVLTLPTLRPALYGSLTGAETGSLTGSLPAL